MFLFRKHKQGQYVNHTPLSPSRTRLSTMYSYMSIWNVGKVGSVALLPRLGRRRTNGIPREREKKSAEKGLYLSTVYVASRGSTREERRQGGEKEGAMYGPFVWWVMERAWLAGEMGLIDLID